MPNGNPSRISTEQAAEINRLIEIRTFAWCDGRVVTVKDADNRINKILAGKYDPDDDPIPDYNRAMQIHRLVSVPPVLEGAK